MIDYPAARLAAEAIHPHYLRFHESIGSSNSNAGFAPVPSRCDIEELTDAAFWTSLLREEKANPRVSLALLPPNSQGTMQFERPLPLLPQSLSRVAPAVERPGLHLAVWREDGRYFIWGVMRTLPPLTLVIEVVAPGLLVIKHSRDVTSPKFANLAVLEGNRVKIIDNRSTLAPNCPTPLLSLMRFDTSTEAAEISNVLVELAVSMRAHGRGGSLLVVPAGTEDWRESILRPLAYAVSPPYAKIAYLLRQDMHQREDSVWQRSLDRTIQAIAGLTAVDGATLVNEHFDVLAFGTKITRRDGLPLVENVMITEPLVDVPPVIAPASEIGGTRHLSAAQFVHDQKDALALVASQDGRFTVFAWSNCDDIVQAHMVESLLL